MFCTVPLAVVFQLVRYSVDIHTLFIFWFIAGQQEEACMPAAALRRVSMQRNTSAFQHVCITPCSVLKAEISISQHGPVHGHCK